MSESYPVQLDVDYADRPLNRLTTALRVFTIIPIAIVLGTVVGRDLELEAARATRRERWSSAPVACCSPARC